MVYCKVDIYKNCSLIRLEMKKTSLIKNSILNVCKTSLSIIFPLITYPYVLRVIGVSNIGAATYVSSVIGFFALLAMLGVSSYAVREGAKLRENRSELQLFTSQIFTINVLSAAFSMLILGITVALIPRFHPYMLLFVILSCNIWMPAISLDWINVVYEDYAYLSVRSILTHVISLACIFLFVKDGSDYYIYIVLLIMPSAVECLSNWFYCRRYVRIRTTLKPELRKHLPKLFVFLFSALSVSIYVSFDNTMLGWMKGEYDVGLYTPPVKIYTIMKSLMVALYIVTVPRLASLHCKNRKEEFKQLYTSLWCAISVILIPAAVGLICISKEVIWFFGGREYMQSITTMRILSLSVIPAIFGGLITGCLNITIHREKENLIAALLAGLLNCGLNLYFIGRYSYTGAAVTTLIAEVFVFLFCFIRLPDKSRYMDIPVILKNMGQSLLASLPIIPLSFILHRINCTSIVCMGIMILTSAAVYFLIMFLLRNQAVIGIYKNLKNRLAAFGHAEKAVQ